MREEVSERIEANKTNRELNEFPETEPSEKQKEFILTLAKTVGLEIDLSKLKDKQKASQLIDKLKQLNNQMSGNRGKSIEKRFAFELATKAIFRNYVEQGKDPTKHEKFWEDVKKFCDDYITHQEILLLKEVI